MDNKRSTVVIDSKMVNDGYNGKRTRVYHVYDNSTGEIDEVYIGGFHRKHRGVNPSPLKTYYHPVSETYTITYIFYAALDGNKYAECFMQIFHNKETGLKEWHVGGDFIAKKQYNGYKQAKKALTHAIGSLTIDGFLPCELLGYNRRRVESGELVPGWRQ
jgi:hypothetical protein